VCSLRCMVETNLLAGSVSCATRVPILQSAAGSWQAGVSERDELAIRSFPRTALESDHEAHLERCCQPPKRLWLGRMLTALHARDRRVARAHPFGELLLGEPELGGSPSSTLSERRRFCRWQSCARGSRSRNLGQVEKVAVRRSVPG
jgi:hypothetical protein